MAEELPGGVLYSSTRGVTGTHASRGLLRVLAGPSTGAQFNTVQAAIFPVACWRAEDVNFEFDSSFVQPEAREQVRQLKALMEQHAGSPLSLFGHADPIGNDEYNKALSGRRAIAVFAMLVRRVAMWDELAGSEGWGNRALGVMLRAVNAEAAAAEEGGLSPAAVPAANEASAVPMPPPAPAPRQGASTDPPPAPELIRQFQQTHNLNPDGILGPQTRKALFLAYMDHLCPGPDGNPFELRPDQFLGGGADPGGKADYQGCGEFNPVLMFSAADRRKFEQMKDKTDRNRANAPNRRVLGLLFRPGIRVSPGRWPCPRAREGPAACRSRFWSDAARRRTFQETERKFEETHDTFACRFYDRLNFGSPCEKVVPGPPGICFVFLKLFDDLFEVLLTETDYTLRGLERNTKIVGTTDGDGVLRHEQLPDDHYELEVDGRVETIEPFYMAEMEDHDDPWFLRMRGLVVRRPPP